MENDRVQKPVSWDLIVLNGVVKFRKENEMPFSDAVNHCCRGFLEEKNVISKEDGGNAD